MIKLSVNKEAEQIEFSDPSGWNVGWHLETKEIVGGFS